MFGLGLWVRSCPALLSAALVFSGCKSDDGGSNADGGGACDEGEEGCACYGNGTCNDGLRCLSKYCVDPDADEGKADESRDEADGSDAGNASRDESTADDRGDAAVDDSDEAEPDGYEGVSDDGNDDPVSTDDVGVDPSTTDETSQPTGDDSYDDEPVTDEPGAADDVDPSADDSVEPVADDATNPDASVPGDDSMTEEPSPDDTSEPATDDTVGDDATDDAMTDDATDPPSPTGNLITNGNFAAGTDYWSIDVLDVVFDLSGGSLCMSGPPDSYVYGPVGFPLDALDAFSLQAGKTYRLQYEVWISDEVGGDSESMNVKVGQAVEPYEPVITWDVQVSNARSTYTNEFVADGDYLQVGVVFLIETAVKEMCFDNVSFVALD